MQSLAVSIPIVFAPGRDYVPLRFTPGRGWSPADEALVLQHGDGIFVVLAVQMQCLPSGCQRCQRIS
jgi:hypothetical protein